MSNSPMAAWLKAVSTEDATSASVSIDAGKPNKEDPANAVPGEHAEKAQGSSDGKRSELHVKKPEDLDVTDVPHEDDAENQGNRPADAGIKANGDIAPGKRALGDGTVVVSSEDAKPTEPVIGGKMVDENKMDEDPRGSVKHLDTKHEDTRVTTKEMDLPNSDPETDIDPDDAIDKMKDHNPGVHEPNMTREARKQLEGEFHTANVNHAKVSIEARDDVELLQESGVNPADLQQPAAPIGNTGADARDLGTDAAAGGGEVEPASADVAPPTELGAEIADISGETTDPVQEAAEHMSDVADDLADMEKMQASVERYREILERATQGGNTIDPLLAESVKIGLESFGESWLSSAVPSLESFSDPTGKFVVSNEAIDNLKQKSASLIEGMKTAIAKLFEWLEDLWNRFAADAGKLHEQAAALQAQAKKVNQPNTEPMPIKGAGRLFIGDTFAGDSVQPLSELHKYGTAFLVTYPKMVNAMLDRFLAGIKRQQGNTSDIDIIDVAVNTYSEGFKPQLLGLAPVTGEAVPDAFKSFNAAVGSKPLPGNMAFYAGLNKVEQNAAAAGALAADKVFKMGFERIPGTKPASETVNVKAPDGRMIDSMLGGVIALCNLLEEMNAQKAELAKIRDRAGKVAGELGAAQGSFKIMSTAAMVYQAMAKNTATPLGAFSGYLASVIKVYLAVCKSYLAHHVGETVNTNRLEAPAQASGAPRLPATA